MLRGPLGGSIRHYLEQPCGSGWLEPAFSKGGQSACGSIKGRPGPISGGVGSRLGFQMAPETLLHAISDFRASCADTRVEGRIGGSPSEATHPASCIVLFEAKHCSPFGVLGPSPLKGLVELFFNDLLGLGFRVLGFRVQGY